MSELDLASFNGAFLEATKPAASVLIEKHAQRRQNWLATEVLPLEVVAEAVLYNAQARADDKPLLLPDSPGIGAAIDTFLLTEEGITYYPEVVAGVFKPDGRTYDDNDPHDVFARWWPTEEFQHSLIGQEIAKVMGRDMIQLELERQAFGKSGLIPRPTSTVEGVAYTALQESSTAKPYENLVKRLAEVAGPPEQLSSLAQTALAGVIDAYKRTAQDERLHRAFIAGNARAALTSGDASLASAMLVAIEKVFSAFAMPGKDGIPKFGRKAALIRREGIFTAKDVAQGQLHLLRDVWRVANLANLTGRGRESQAQLVAHISTIEQMLEPAA